MEKYRLVRAQVPERRGDDIARAREAGFGAADDATSSQTGKTIPQVALNWLLQRPTVSTVLIGARNEEQLRDNLGAVGWNLSKEQLAALDAASEVTPPYPYYPYWNGQLAERNPAPVTVRQLRAASS